MRVLVLENDPEISERLASYIAKNGLDAEIIYMVDQKDTMEIMSKFAEHEVLLFQPNMVTVHQYDMMLMLMYDLLTRDELRIKCVEIMYPSDRIDGELKRIWSKKRKYLERVLEVVKIYRIDSFTKEKTKLEI